jgi:hypothetical protein
VGGIPGTVAGEICTNADSSESLFGEVKKHKVNGKLVKSRSICHKINWNKNPELPASKVDQKPICLDWHTIGMCNLTCPCAADHVNYTDAKYSALVRWCGEHYPKEPKDK